MAATTEQRIGNVVRSIAAVTGDDRVSLGALRKVLADIPRAELDATLVRLYEDQRVNLIATADPVACNRIGDENALRCGGREKYQVTWNR
jgi:ethanolamine ammonia-lyase large subunit